MKEWTVNIRTVTHDIETTVDATNRATAYSKVIQKHRELINEFSNDESLTITIVEYVRNGGY